MSDLFLGIIILVLQFLVRDSLSVIPFDSAKTLINPFNYEENKMIFNVLILMFILMIFIINYLIKDFSDIYDMRNFILSRCSKKKMFLMIFKKGLLSILKIYEKNALCSYSFFNNYAVYSFLYKIFRYYCNIKSVYF